MGELLDADGLAPLIRWPVLHPHDRCSIARIPIAIALCGVQVVERNFAWLLGALEGAIA